MYYVFRRIFPTLKTKNKTLMRIIKRRNSTNGTIVESKAPFTEIPDKKITSYVWSRLDQWHDKTAVICFETGQSYTYGQIYHKSQCLAGSLRHSFGLNPKDTVAIVLANVPEFPIVFLGALEAELVVTTVNPIYTADEIATQLKDSDAKLIFTTGELSPFVSKAVQLLEEQILIVLTDVTTAVDNERFVSLSTLCEGIAQKFVQESTPDDVACLPYSSGTTGLAKGVLLTHRNVVSNLCQMSSPNFAVNLKTEGDFQDIIPVFLPLFHIYGLVCIFLNFFSQGCKLVTVPKFLSPQFSRLLTTYRPTLIFAVPQLITSLINNSKIKPEELSSIRTVVSAAAPLGVAVVEKFSRKTQDKVNLIQMYGMTETSPLTLMQTTLLEDGKKIGGSGFLLPNTQCKVIRTEDELDNKPLGVKETGELVMKGPQVMKGYHNNLQATEEVLLGGEWLRTGDIGYYDEHEHFFITDRLKELIKVKGFQVAPAELEEVLRNHTAIKDVAVVGVPHPVQGEAPRAFVVLDENAKLRPEQIKEFVASKVASYKRLVGGVVVIERIPRNVAGKVLRRQLRCL